jgi:N-methylhydantoinase A
MTEWRVGVDSGGTFTDICLMNAATGAIRVWKVPSSPDDPSRAIADGLIEGLAQAASARPTDAVYFGHGTTVATNALIQHRGVRTGLITTAGFRDLLEIGRQRRPHLYDLQCDKPPCLVPRDLRLEVAERMKFDGRVETPLDEAAVRAAARSLKAAGVEAVAICFLYSYVDPIHEARAKNIVEEELPEAFVTASHLVAPEFREYERFSTTVVNAYLGPILSRYVARLATRLDAAGVRGPRHITQSNGGVMSFATAERQAVRTVLSGPATGVVGALKVGEFAGFRNLITFDMGGTSTDVALIQDGRPTLASELEVHGYPLKTPALDIHTVGAGGGSIAYLDAGGHLKVGPRSAGSVPGPACYGLGNEEPTVTDANVALQTLNPTHLLAGRMPIDRAQAVRAVDRLASRLGLDSTATAQGIVSVVTANMAKAIRLISVQRGHDPRDYTLVAFGGAGPLHAGRLARELDIPRILVPRNPGILCALGLLLSDLKTTFSRTRILMLDTASVDEIESTFRDLEKQASRWFETESLPPECRHLRRSVDLRYAGQNYELTVAIADGDLTTAAKEQIRSDFAAAHQRLYGYVAESEPIQMITFRVEAIGMIRATEFQRHPAMVEQVHAARTGEREVWLGEIGRSVLCPVYDRDRLQPGHVVRGPSVIEQMDATTLLLPDQTARVDEALNLVITDA